MNARAVLVSPLGFLIGVSLGALGGGGSILTVPVLVYGAGQDTLTATTTSLLIVAIVAVAGMLSHLRAGQVRVRAGIVFGAAGVGGSLLGTRLNQAVDPDLLLLAFAGLMVVVAWRMVRARPIPGREQEPPPTENSVSAAGRTAHSEVAVAASLTRGSVATGVLKVASAGTAVGFVTGFFGVGGGFVVVPALVLSLDFEMPEAVGTSLLVIAINSLVALATRLGTTGIDWAVAGPFIAAGLLGVSAGRAIAGRFAPSTLMRMFAVLVAVIAVFVAVNATVGLLG